jgi:uncharacterized protein
MIVIDTTVLVYAVGDDHPLRQPCRELVATLRDGHLRATTTPEVIQEFAHVRARRRSRDDAAALACDFAVLLAPLMTVEDEDLTAGLSIFTEAATLGAFDAVLAATSRRRGARALVSADRAFEEVRHLRHIDPGVPDLLAALEEG